MDEIGTGGNRRISQVSYLEAADLLASTRDLIASRRFDELVHEAEVTSETGHRGAGKNRAS
ncbi:MAG: hypothetical protein JO249_20240 [Acidobacteria bacterium]|nr:hypothetical protein [Acidobacteriota bacterium]